MKRVLIIGASGFIGSSLAVYLRKFYRVYGTYNQTPIEVDGVTPIKLPLNAGTPIAELVELLNPHAVIYCAAETNEKRCETETDHALFINATAPSQFASRMKASQRFIFLSTSKVFSGNEGNYAETHATSPTSAYGKTKSSAEEMLASYSNVFIVRLGTVFGLGGRHHSSRSLINQYLNVLWNQEAVGLIHDEYRSFISALDLARAIGNLIDTRIGASGIYHLGSERLSHFEFVAKLAGAFELGVGPLSPISGKDFSAKRGPGEPHRGTDLSLATQHFVETFSFQFEPVTAALDRLRASLRTGQPSELGL